MPAAHAHSTYTEKHGTYTGWYAFVCRSLGTKMPNAVSCGLMVTSSFWYQTGGKMNHK